MSREEAIELLDNLIGMVEDNHNSDYDTAFNMAIKALEQEPCEDAISRQDAIRICEERGHDNSAYYIRNLPPVTPQPKTGHWINHYDEDAKEGWYECDRCHTERAFNTDFCPDCGARMVEPQESETWNGYHGQITAPKSTFERIFNDADDEDDI